MKVDLKDIAKVEKMLKAYGSASKHKIIASNCRGCMAGCKASCYSCSFTCKGGYTGSSTKCNML